MLVSVTGYALLPNITKGLYSVSDLQPLDIGVWRFLLATPAIWVLIWARRTPRPAMPLPHMSLLLMGFVYAVAAFTAFFGLQRLPASTYIVLFYTYPAMVALFTVATGTRLAHVAWLALVLTLVGVALTVPDFATMDQNNWIGIGTAVVNAAAVALYFVISGHVLRGHKAIARGSAWVMNGSLLIFCAFALVNGLNVPDNATTWLLLLTLAVFSTVIPIFALNQGIQMIGASRAAIISAAEPVETMILALMLLGETIRPIQWVGALLIIGGVLLLQLRPNILSAVPSGSTGKR